MITLSIREQEKMEIEPPLKRFRSGQVPNPRKESKKESESENTHFGIPRSNVVGMQTLSF